MRQAVLNLDLSTKKTLKQVFLDQMDQVVPWAELVELIAPYYPEGKTGSQRRLHLVCRHASRQMQNTEH